MPRPAIQVGATIGLILCGIEAAVGDVDVDVALRLVPRHVPGPADTVTTLPAAACRVEVGVPFVVELWVSDVGSLDTGIIGAYFDLTFDPVLLQVTALEHSAIYDFLAAGAIDNGSGVVVNFGGIDGGFDGVGVEPEWARLGHVDLTAAAVGQTTIQSALGLGGIGVLGRQPPTPSQIDFGVAAISIGGCPADIDCSGTVGIVDFLALLAAWGPNPGHPADIDRDGTVGITDFLELLANWGPCP